MVIIHDPVSYTHLDVYKRQIVDLLAKCKTEQYTIAVATAKPEHYAKDILDHFELTPYFDVIVGANYEAGLLHKKEILEKALTLCGNPLTDENGRRLTFMVGDRKYDVEAANELEMCIRDRSCCRY